MDLFRKLNAKEEARFRASARRNYKPLSPIEGIWHPVYQDECRRINEKAGRTAMNAFEHPSFPEHDSPIVCGLKQVLSGEVERPKTEIERTDRVADWLRNESIAAEIAGDREFANILDGFRRETIAFRDRRR